MSEDEHGASVKFISDDAAASDFFGSHEPVATAIETVIKTDARLKVIGLLGAWGSGKSTVLNILRTKLEALRPAEDVRFFIYDAWVHQSDPPRRAFLETLVEFLVAEKLTSKANWQDDLDRLNRRIEEHDTQSTPTLSTSGKFITLSLLLFPIGISLLSPLWTTHTFKPFGYDTGISVLQLGLLLLLTPILVTIIIYFAWRPTRNPFNREFYSSRNWNTHRHPHERSTIFSIFINKATDRITNRVIRNPDPTAIEFQETYQKIMSAVYAPKRRFIFVVDNLDRIPESEAVLLWSTIRSFFLAVTPISISTNFTHPIVILPMDPNTVQRMYAHDGDGISLAQSFLDKTFDLVFRVAPPVVSDWQAYLENKMREALGSQVQDRDVYIINRLYESHLDTKKTATVTPRTLIKLVNSIASIKLQHGNEIPLVAIAYYAIHKDSIEEGISALINSEDSTLERLDPEWRTYVAAIYFNVSTSKSLQLLMMPQLRTSVTERDPTTFNNLSMVPGFERVLERFTEAAFGPSPEIPANIASLIADKDLQKNPQLDAINRNLRAALSQPTPWNSMNEGTPPKACSICYRVVLTTNSIISFRP